MFALGNLVNAVAVILDWAITLYMIVIFVRAFLSWVNPDPYNPIVKFLNAATEPALRPFRRLLPPWKTGGIDLSPLFVLAILMFLRYFAVATLFELARRLK